MILLVVEVFAEAENLFAQITNNQYRLKIICLGLEKRFCKLLLVPAGFRCNPHYCSKLRQSMTKNGTDCKLRSGTAVQTRFPALEVLKRTPNLSTTMSLYYLTLVIQDYHGIGAKCFNKFVSVQTQNNLVVLSLL